MQRFTALVGIGIVGAVLFAGCTTDANVNVWTNNQSQDLVSARLAVQDQQGRFVYATAFTNVAPNTSEEGPPLRLSSGVYTLYVEFGETNESKQRDLGWSSKTWWNTIKADKTLDWGITTT